MRASPCCSLVLCRARGSASSKSFRSSLGRSPLRFPLADRLLYSVFIYSSLVILASFLFCLSLLTLLLTLSLCLLLGLLLLLLSLPAPNDHLLLHPNRFLPTIYYIHDAPISRPLQLRSNNHTPTLLAQTLKPSLLPQSPYCSKIDHIPRSPQPHSSHLRLRAQNHASSPRCPDQLRCVTDQIPSCLRIS